MENRQLIHRDRGLLDKTEVWLEPGLLVYARSELFERSVLQAPLASVHLEPSFLRTYHLGPIAGTVFLSYLSIRLLIKRWNTHHWTLYLALGLLSAFALGYLYYFFKGRHYGQVSLWIGGQHVKLYMTEDDYLKFKSIVEPASENNE
jgi:hypothetical protein